MAERSKSLTLVNIDSKYGTLIIIENFVFFVISTTILILSVGWLLYIHASKCMHSFENEFYREYKINLEYTSGTEIDRNQNHCILCEIIGSNFCRRIICVKMNEVINEL